MSDDGAPRQELPEDPETALAAEYVLRLLDPLEEVDCAAREARDPAFAAKVEAWRVSFEGLDGAFEPVQPPAALAGRVTARLFGRRPSALARLWQSAGLWRAVAAAAAVAAVYLALPGPPVTAPSGEGPARLVSALASVDSDVQVLAVYEPQAAVLNVTRLSGEPAPGRSLQLWVALGGDTPTSLGVLPDTEYARIPLTRELAERIETSDHFAVSDEPAGGSEQPTTVVARGNITQE